MAEQTSNNQLQGGAMESARHTAANVKKQINIVKLSDVFAITLKNWYWVVASLIVCVGLSVLYALKTEPIYTSSMAVMVRDDAQSPMGSSSIDLEDIGIMSTNTVLEDEIAALKSPDLMKVVVKKLNLDVNYTIPGTFHNTVLYGSNIPVKVSFPDMPASESARLKLKVDKQGKISVENLVVNGRNLLINPATPLQFGSAIATPSGRILIEKTPFFQEGQPVEEDVTRYSEQTATSIYSSEISIESPQAKKSNVITITCNDRNPQRACDILNALIEAYNQDWINAKAQVVATTNQFITERLNAVESELGSVDNNISSFKSSNLIPDLSQASNIYMQESNATSNQILQLNNQLQMTKYLRNYVTSEGKNQVLPVNTGISNSIIEGLISQYNTAMLARNQHVSNSSESNPVVIEYDSRLAALRSSILSSIDNQEVSLSTTIRNLERNEQSANARVAANPRQARFLLSAERQQKVQESLYLYLLQKREENELSQAFTQVNTRIIRRPVPSGAPSSPKKSQIYLIGFVLGLIIVPGVVYVKEASNTKVRGRKDLDGLSLPIIGEIPRFKYARKVSASYFANSEKHRDQKSIQGDVVVQEGNRNMVNEAFRVLRTNVNFITADSPHTTVMMTSFNPGSGKTFISVNLGISLAIKNRKVLLVDCDLRRATLSKFVGSPHKGIAEYLAGSIHDVAPVIRKNSIMEGLDILPVGTIPPNPTELLESKRFTNLVEYLRSEYDFVVLDCPPVEMMADAQIVAQVCDRTFFVVRIGLFERAMLEHLDRIYREKKYPNMSVILNDSATGTRYGYTYRYGYGYGAKGYKGYSKYYSKK